ncbi:hypothetical protein PMI29_03324 [Pseudomonas sp. GM49]|uniref:type VI secretion system contractile sheath domain-containing protein n=1 Tax=Pseudomonas sp. GM49 TaxID=1144331 RepID=UPI00027016F5|nr:type VI secretion system contractile sheath large subunit [Pseudomonas sp. GM49]EJM63679.1 hypothetical protein PMI29_03324 [Pseudomonas sp. GM49]
MSIEHSHAQSRGTTMLPEENQSVYGALFGKINLNPVKVLGEIEVFQSSEALSDVSVDERVTAAVSVFLKLIKQSSRKVRRLDKTLLDEHIASLDAQISRQLDAVMHHPDFQRVESTWRGVKSLIDQTDFRQNVRIELLDVSKGHLVQDFEDAPEIAQSGLYVHTYTQEYDTPGGEPIAAAISNFEFDRSPQDIALLRNISKVSAAAHMPFIGSVGPAFFGKRSMDEVAAIKDIGTRNAEGITALVTLLAPGTRARITPHWPQKIALAQPASLSASHPVSLSRGTPLGGTGYDANSQLHLALFTRDQDEARGWLPDGQLYNDLLVLLRVYLGWRCTAKLQLSLPVRSLPQPVLGQAPILLGMTGMLGSGCDTWQGSEHDTITINLGRYQGLSKNTRNREIQHVAYRW